MLQKWKQKYIINRKKQAKIMTKIYKIMKWFDIFGQIYENPWRWSNVNYMLIIRSNTCKMIFCNDCKRNTFSITQKYKKKENYFTFFFFLL